MTIESDSQDALEVVLTYHQYLQAMTYLTSSEAKRQWRKAIKNAWGNRCSFCGQPPIDDKSLTIDHMRPRCKGGEDISKNCLPACLRHNQEKGSSDWRPWFREQSFYDRVREARIVFWLENSKLPTEEELLRTLERLPQ
jgi:hypothetical protein